MKKFEFRLASVLRLREAHLTIEKNKLQQLFGQRAKIENSLRTIGEERGEAEKWIHAMSNPASGDLRALSAFLLGSKAREATLQQGIQNCDEMIGQQRQVAVFAERNVKLLLNLRTKQKAGWQKEFEKELESVAEEAWQSAARSKRPH